MIKRCVESRRGAGTVRAMLDEAESNLARAAAAYAKAQEQLADGQFHDAKAALSQTLDAASRLYGAACSLTIHLGMEWSRLEDRVNNNPKEKR